jgi:hypothetical protein
VLLSSTLSVIWLAGGKLLLELNRLLRPGGYFVWSATPVYQKLPEDVEIWEGKFHDQINSLLQPNGKLPV